MIGRALAVLTDYAFNRIAPINLERRYLGADYLSNAEQHIDVWEPDELWAAEQRRTAETPAGADVPALPPRSVAGAGGSTTDLEVLLTIRRVLRDCDVPWAHTTAGIITRELLHHYTVTPR